MNIPDLDEDSWPAVVPPPPPLILRGIEHTPIAKWKNRYIHFEKPLTAEEEEWRSYVKSEIAAAGGLSQGWDPEEDLMHVFVWRLLNDDKLD